MGVYLSSPITDKNSEDGDGESLRFGVSSMQGWRRGMEDSHIAAVKVGDTDVSFFGVYDGHGGMCDVSVRHAKQRQLL